DAAGLARILGDRGRVICDAEIASYIATQGLKVIPVRRCGPVTRGPITLSALSAVDGRGDQQVSWVISAAVCASSL
ncbi:MAG: hypothetical protein R3348_08930, partial [Xanthomonadales bacterium]|nr:hypothetical protein [Xanthomonadales bacterium]